MWGLRSLGLLAALGAAWLPAAGAAPSGPTLELGPVLAGARVVWVERTADLSSHVLRAGGGGSPPGELYRSDLPFVDVAASRDLVAFSRHGWAHGLDATDALVGPPAGPFAELVPLDGACGLGVLTGSRKRGGTLLPRVDVDGDLVAFSEPHCETASVHVRVVRVDPRTRGRRSLLDLPLARGCCPDVAVARRFVAWTEPDDTGVGVYDLSTRRAKRVPLADRAAGTTIALDVDSDGTVAILYRRYGEAFARVLRVAPGKKLEVVDRSAVEPFAGGSVRVANGRIAFERWAGATRTELVVLEEGAPVRRLSQRAAAFDLNDARAAWESVDVARRRVECPQTEPCYTHETGSTTLRSRALASSATEVAARLALDRRAAPPFHWRRLTAGPVLAGRGVAWSDYAEDGRLALRLRDGGSERILASGLGGPLVASQEAIGVGGRDVYAGPLREGIVRLPAADCFREWSLDRVPAVDGPRVASIECVGGEPTVVVRDLASGKRLTVDPRVTGHRCCVRVRLAGRYVAWLGFNSTVVTIYDRLALRVLHRVYLPEAYAPFDLQEDGRLAIALAGRAAWYAAGGTRTAEVPGLRADEIRAVRGRAVLLLRADRGGGQLTLVGADGRRRTIASFVEPGTPGPVRVGTFDFDGETVTWASERVARRRTPCGSRGSCRTLETGTFTIWRFAPGRDRLPRAVAVVRFTERPT